MALSDDDEDQSVQSSNSTTLAHDTQPGYGASSSDSGPRNGRHPIPASDHFAAELPKNLDISDPTAQTVVASTGARVTSACGTQGLDMISKATVLGQQSNSTFVPDRDVCPHISIKEDTSSNNTVSSEAASAETDSQRTIERNGTNATDSLPLTSAPPLSLDSLNHDESDPAHLLAATSVPFQESEQRFGAETPTSPGNGADVCRRLELSNASSLSEDSKQTIHHFAENSISSEGQRDSSGYRSDSVSSLFKPGKGRQNKAVQYKNTCRQKTAVCTSLQLSETGINDIKCESGTRRNPFYPSYSSLPRRLGSFPDGFHLGDGVPVNRDLLALAGFFYSGRNTVTCFHCGCSPRLWGDGRDPKTEHRKLSPYCRAHPVLRD